MWLSGFLAAEVARIRKGTDFSNGLQGENMALSQAPYNHLVSSAGATRPWNPTSPREEKDDPERVEHTCKNVAGFLWPGFSKMPKQRAHLQRPLGPRCVRSSIRISILRDQTFRWR
jgi:hypothetical protein